MKGIGIAGLAAALGFPLWKEVDTIHVGLMFEEEVDEKIKAGSYYREVPKGTTILGALTWVNGITIDNLYRTEGGTLLIGSINKKRNGENGFWHFLRKGEKVSEAPLDLQLEDGEQISCIYASLVERAPAAL